MECSWRTLNVPRCDVVWRAAASSHRPVVSQYGPNKEPFHFWLFTAAVCSVFNCIIAYAALRFSHSRKDALDVSVPQSKWAIIAVMQSAATASSLMSLE